AAIGPLPCQETIYQDLNPLIGQPEFEQGEDRITFHRGAHACSTSFCVFFDGTHTFFREKPLINLVTQWDEFMIPCWIVYVCQHDQHPMGAIPLCIGVMGNLAVGSPCGEHLAYTVTLLDFELKVSY